MNLELLGNASCFVVCGRYTSGNKSYIPDSTLGSNLVLFFFFQNRSGRIIRRCVRNVFFKIYAKLDCKGWR